MTDGFGDLGLRPELIEACEEAGYARPTAVQGSAIPVLRRGGNAVLHASAGAGVVAAYGLALLDRLAGGVEPEPEGADAGGVQGAVEDMGAGTADYVHALVLVPTDGVASETAMSLARFARRLDLRVTALGPGWPGPGPATHAVVATPAAALRAVEGSLLKLERLRSLVLDGASAMLALDARDAIEALTGSVSRDAQRVITTGKLTNGVDDYVERHVRRALHMPARAAEPEEAAEPTGEVGYAVAAATAKLDAVTPLLLDEPGRTAIVFGRTSARLGALADALALRGFQIRRMDNEAGETGDRKSVV